MENEADVQLGVPRTKKRKWWLAGLLSVLISGLGQIYNGQLTKGIIFFSISYVIPAVLIPLLLSQPSLLFLVIFALMFFFFDAYVVLDAIIHARRIGNNYVLKPYNRVLVFIGILIMSFLIDFFVETTIKAYVIQAYKIPAGSMEPTLLIGDHLLVDKLGNAVKNPQSGDIIVFKYPPNPKIDFIKRIVAVGGDVVEIRDKELYINNELIKKDYAIHKNTPIIPKELSPKDNFGPVTVPPDSYFVLGDNRDNSADSRFWGFVGKDKVKGVARIIYFSWDRHNSSVRWKRIGQRIS